MSDTAKQRARDLVQFCDGVEEAGWHEYARRGRVVADLLLAALAELEAERSARVALQERCETLQDIVGKGAYYAAIAGADRVESIAFAKHELQRLAREELARSYALDEERGPDDEPEPDDEP